MLPSHCNKCYKLQEEQQHTLQLYLSICGHVLCKNCVAAICAICKRNYKPMPLGKNMSPAYAVYFEDPLKQFKRARKVVKFQLEQQKNYINYGSIVLPQQMKNMNSQQNAIVKLEGRLSAECDSEKNRVEKLNTYLAYCERILEQPINMPPPIRTSTAAISNSQRYFTNTPTISSLSNDSGDDIEDEDLDVDVVSFKSVNYVL